MAEIERPLAVVTGSSRGIGAEIALKLASHFDILGNHSDPSRQKEMNQSGVISRVESIGGRMRSVTADITTEEGRSRLFEEARLGNTGIAVLCLNAAGGLEKDEGEYYARKINTEAQWALVNKFRSILAAGAVVIYPTSIYAHGWLPNQFNGYRQFRQPPGYPLVASTKFEAESGLRNDDEIKLGVVVSPVVNHTAAHTMFKRYYRARLAKMESYCADGVFPEPGDLAEAVKELALGDHPSGHTIYVGGDRAEYADRRAFEPYELDRRGIAGLLPMYSKITLKADEFISPLGSKLFGATRYQVRPYDVRGHFAGKYGKFKVEKGVDLSEIGAQAIGLTYLSADPQEEAVAFFGEHRSSYEKLVFPYEVVTVRTEITGLNARGVLGRCEFFVPAKKGGEIKVAEMTGVRVALVPSIKEAKKMYAGQLAERDIPDHLIF